MYFNLSYALCVLVLISYSSSVHYECKSLDPINYYKGSLLNLRYRPISINIDTKNVQSVSTSKPLLITSRGAAKTFLVNTGKSVETINQIQNVANVDNGVLQDDYIWLKFQYYWTKNSTGTTGTTIDGRGFPYEVRVLWRNSKYSTISEAVKHEYGFIEIVFLFHVVSADLPPNIPFQGLSDKIKSIQKAGTYAPITLDTQVKAANFIPKDSPYYSYSGRMLDTSTGQKYNCTTVIVIKPNPSYFLNQNQFDETFGKLKDFSGKPFTNTLSQDSGDVSVSEAIDVAQVFLN